MDRRIAAPVDEGAKHAAINQVAQDCTDPPTVEFQELCVGHFARCHRELAVSAARDIVLDLNVVGFVGENEAAPLIAHEPNGGQRDRVTSPQMMRWSSKAKFSPTQTRCCLASSWLYGPFSSAAASSDRTIWSILSNAKPVISIGASETTSSSNSILGSARSHLAFLSQAVQCKPQEPL